MMQPSWPLERRRGGAVFGSILGILLSCGCGTPVYLVEREALQRALTTPNPTDIPVGVTAVAQDARSNTDLRTASLGTLPGEKVILRKETINVLPTKPYEEFKDPGNKMQRVTGEPFSPSDGTNGPLALSITGGILLTGGLLFGGWLIWASQSSPGEACPENCRLGRGIGQIVGGAGAAVLGIPGLLMLGVGLSQYSERKSNPKRRMVVY